jgi:peptidylprolyl isomerase
VPTNKQRRDAARRHLERQLQRRKERETARRRFTLIGSIIATVVLVAGVVTGVVAASSGGKKKAASDNPTVASPTASTPTPTPTPSTSYPAATGPAVTFDGVTVKGAADLKGRPGVTSKASADPKKLLFKDLVVGKGAVATSTSNVTVQYVGVLYKNGTLFDASWDRGSPASFSLNGGVIKGFQEGIGGAQGVPPMHVGGRRLIILPASLGYGAQGAGTIPANASIVFVVDLTKVG